jgi:hypothetical protein
MQRSGHKGKPHPDRWKVIETNAPGVYSASRIIDYQIERRTVRAHCLICAKAKVLREYGGKVDKRGINHPGIDPKCAEGLRDAVKDQA